MGHQEVHQDVFAIGRLLDRLQQEQRQPVGVQVIVVFVVERGSCQHNRVVIGPLGRVSPGILKDRHKVIYNLSSPFLHFIHSPSHRPSSEHVLDSPQPDQESRATLSTQSPTRPY